MKLRVALAIFSIFLFLLPNESFAATEGCPDSWSVDLTKYPNNPDLISAKQKLGGNMVETLLSSSFLTYDGLAGSQPPFPELISITGGSQTAFRYLYGKSLIRYVVQVEVKGCNKPHSFIFTSSFMNLEYEDIAYKTPAEWATLNPQAFRDFKEQEAFPQNLSNKVNEVQKLLDSFILNGKPLPPIFVNIVFNQFQTLAPITRMSIQTLTPDCLVRDSRIKTELAFKLGKKCDFAISYYERPGSSSNTKLIWTFLDKFTLDLTDRSKTINCVKGKLTRKITSSNPKCPVGYKKK